MAALKIVFLMALLGYFPLGSVNSELIADLTLPLKLIDYASEILCSFDAKMVYVYFENDTSLSYPSQILQKLNTCGTSYILLR